MFAAAVILCLVLTGLPIMGTLVAAEPSPGGSISGFVYEADGITPIEGADVRAMDWEALPFQPTGEATTDGSGYYVITELAAGDYRVSARATGRAYELYHETYLYDEVQPVTVIEAQVTTDINFTLGPGGNISGMITSAGSGLPLSEVNVLASPSEASAVGGWSLSDESGNYTITSLPYGTYVVRSPSEWRFGSGDDGYMMEFWQEKSDWGDADPVTVSEGVNPTGINFTLELGGTVSGYVYEEDGMTPIPSLHVYATDYHTDVWVAGNNTDEEGRYSLLLPAGTYRVRACASCSGLQYVDEYYDDA